MPQDYLWLNGTTRLKKQNSILSMSLQQRFTSIMMILNFYNNRASNAMAESFNAKIKLFRANLRGVADKKFFLFRIANLYAYPHRISTEPKKEEKHCCFSSYSDPGGSQTHDLQNRNLTLYSLSYQAEMRGQKYKKTIHIPNFRLVFFAIELRRPRLFHLKQPL